MRGGSWDFGLLSKFTLRKVVWNRVSRKGRGRRLLR